MSDTSLGERIKELSKENMAKKLLEKKPDTFSILYRSGSIKRETGPRIIEHNGEEVDIETPDIHFTGKFNEDISDYFKNRLIEGGVDIKDDILIRTSPLSWTIYFEVYCGLVEIDGSTISTNDLFNNNRVNLVEPCEMNIIENIPMCLFDKFNIIHYAGWGEVVTFNHDKLKSEMLDKCMRSSSKENIDTSYQEILNIMEQFPNKYNVLSGQILDIMADKPIEIIREENRILNLLNTDKFKRLIDEKRSIELQEPNQEDDGVFIIENGRHVKGPNYDSWKTSRDEWITSYKTWFKNIEYDYKLCFKACYEKEMILDGNIMIMLHDGNYMGRDIQFPGFIMHTNISGNTIF